jgi:G3E family GTPase
MSQIRFLMIGGFLGAGKTTLIARLAQHYLDKGLKVGIVTNDQAYDLVDTHALRAQGFDVGEVPGACFCCKFNDLVETAEQLSAETTPDVIIAEPVGSCTDLVATVIEPLRHLHNDQYEIAPLAVLLKPEHGQKILREDQGVGFSPKAAYIFLKQIEEADIVVVNKIDKLDADERSELIGLVQDKYPNKQVVAISGRDGAGTDELFALLTATTTKRQQMMDVDYDVYAEGEAELGWLNAAVKVTAKTAPFPLDDLLLELVQRLGMLLQEADAESAHLKIMGQADDTTAIANLVSSDVAAELSMTSHVTTSAADLIVNARVAIDPEQLEKLVLEGLDQVATARELSVEVGRVQRFRPGRPVPTHRISP